MGLPPGAVVVAFAVASNLIGACTYPATRLAVEGLPEITVALVRTVAAVAFLSVPAWRHARPFVRQASGRDWALVGAIGVFGYALPVALGNFGMRRSTVTHASLLIGVEPIAIALLSAVLLRERLSALRVTALGAGFAGAATVVSGGLPVVSAGTVTSGGDLLLILQGIAWAIYTIAAKPLLLRHGFWPVTLWPLAASLPVLAAGAWIEPPRLPPPAEPGRAVLWAIALGVAGSALAAVLWNAALARMDASRMAGFIFLQPLAGVVLGRLWMGDSLSVATSAGGVLVLLGVYLAIRDDRRRAPMG